MTVRRLTVIPKPGPDSGRLVLNVGEGGLKGDGPLDLVCGVCDEVLAAGVPDDQLHNLRAALERKLLSQGGVGVSGPKEELILKCPSCGAYNEVRAGSDPAKGGF